MSHITVDTALRDQLLGAVTETEIRDEQGHKLGRFIPEVDPAVYDIPESGLSPEELARRMGTDVKTFTTEEVMAYVRSLA